MAGVYLTIWLALALFAAGEIGRSWRPQSRWAWPAFAIGLALAVAHTLLAFHVVHDWSHAHAVAATAAQTKAVYGTAVSWGVYVNYLFFTVWFADAMWWRRSPGRGEPANAARWALRGFYLVIVGNGAIVFAAGWRRGLGVALVGLMVAAWGRPFTSMRS